MKPYPMKVRLEPMTRAQAIIRFLGGAFLGIVMFYLIILELSLCAKQGVF